jgi:hypothetical protein
MNVLDSIITYVRRIVKSPSDAVLSSNLIIDYVNRFYLMDVQARIQLFDYKTKYQFQTVPGVDRYNMPLYSIQSETPGAPASPDIKYYPVYQGFLDPVYINGIQIPFQTDKTTFFNIWPNIVQQMAVVATGNGGATYTLNFPIAPQNQNLLSPPFQYILRGHVDITGIIANANALPPLQDPIFATTINTAIPTTSIYPAVYITTNDANNNSIVVSDSGQFLFQAGANMPNYGLLMISGNAPYGTMALTGGYSTTSNTVNYQTGVVNVTFPTAIPLGASINAQCFFFQCGLPRGMLFNNNVITLRSPPDQQYLVEIDAYLSPAAFFSQPNAIPFGYMAEYIARGAARKLLSDTGDVEQFQFYEPLFNEQEKLVWKRSQRQFTASRTQTIYSQGINQGQSGFNNLGGSTL